MRLAWKIGRRFYADQDVGLALGRTWRKLNSMYKVVCNVWTKSLCVNLHQRSFLFLMRLLLLRELSALLKFILRHKPMSSCVNQPNCPSRVWYSIQEMVELQGMPRNLFVKFCARFILIVKKVIGLHFLNHDLGLNSFSIIHRRRSTCYVHLAQQTCARLPCI